MAADSPTEGESSSLEKKPVASSSPMDFETILERIGSRGRYQKLLLYGFLVPFSVVEPIVTTNFIFLLSEPEHWCASPSNVSTEVWKNTSIPRTRTTIGGEKTFSSCSMFNESMVEVPCTNGWEYDRTDFDATITSQYNFVCPDSHYVTDAFTAIAMGHAIGSIIFGQMSDILGRKPVFFMTVLMVVLFRTPILMFPQTPWLFLLSQFLAGMSNPSMYLLSAVILAEMCDPDYRGWIYSFTWMTWVIGGTLLPFLAWVSRSWDIFAWVTTAFGAALLLYYPFLPESPRWLVSRGKTEEAVTALLNMGKVNGRNVSEHQVREMVRSVQETLKRDDKPKETLLTVFSRKRLAVQLILLTISWSMTSFMYHVITFNSTKMAGNQFLNFGILSLMELPAGFFGGRFADSIGRTVTQVFGFCASGLLFLVAAILHNFSHPVWITSVLIFLAKFATTVVTLALHIQAPELFPTNLRATCTGFATTISNVASIVSPTVLVADKIYPGISLYIMTILSVFGLSAGIFLPETLHQRLPETIEDAEEFGKRVPFWKYKTENKTAQPNQSEDSNPLEGIQETRT